MRISTCTGLLALVFKSALTFGGAEVAVSEPGDSLVVTATRTPEPMLQIPADVSLVEGWELRARDALDLASALSLVSGVDAPAGGDAGPSSAVPSFWGLHEFDAFLLVVDGVPWGGAFNPGISTLDFNHIERVEVLKGSAPVMYGATSFVGVIQALHYPAGQAADEAVLALGSYGSLRGSISAALPSSNDYQQSIAIDVQKRSYSDSREVAGNQNLLYRGELNLGVGKLRIDAGIHLVRDVPGSPVGRDGSVLTSLEPLDANFNPADARIDEDKYQLVVGYSRRGAWGSWETLASYTYSRVTDIRGFLHSDLTGSADTQNQHRSIDDGYFDTHLVSNPAPSVTWVVGDDLLYGFGRQKTLNSNSAYTVPLDGSVVPPSTGDLAANEIVTLADRRLFSGQYAQLDWKLHSDWDAMAGIRLNEVVENKDSSDLNLPPPQLKAVSAHKSTIRLTESLGVNYRFWKERENEAVVYADVRTAFKPAANDFGPDFRPNLLQAEQSRSVEVGIKGQIASRLTYQWEAFEMSLSNLVVATDSGALANAGGEKLKGMDAEARFHLTRDFAVAAGGSYHDARYTEYAVFDGISVIDVAGRQLPLSSHVLATLGVLFNPVQGLNANIVAKYVGPRYLDAQNVAAVGGYVTLDASIGFRTAHSQITLEGTNLRNQRPPVTSSEFGSLSFYRLNTRDLWLRVAYHWS